MSDRACSESQLNREADVFCRYLVGRRPPDAALREYATYHASFDIAGVTRASRFDHFLIGFARLGRFAVRVADTHAARFRKRAVLRRKLVLLLAILECMPPTYQIVDRPIARGRVSFWARMLGRGVSEALVLVPAAVVLLPIQLVLALLPDGRPREAA